VNSMHIIVLASVEKIDNRAVIVQKTKHYIPAKLCNTVKFYVRNSLLNQKAKPGD
jgi:hypothetical protein